MKLYLFPAPANNLGGYNIAVLNAFNNKYVVPELSDIIIWYSPNNIVNFYLRENDILINPVSLYSTKSISRILRKRFSQELSINDLKHIKGQSFDEIHCDEVIFYRAIKKLYPKKYISVRFHNVFARILERSKMLDIKSDWRFWGKMLILSRLEKEIMNDTFVKKIFISNKDAEYYELITGRNDYEVWLNEPDTNLISKNRRDIHLSNKIAWLGGVEGHKISSIKWFIDEIFPILKSNVIDLEFHLFGAETEQFNCPINSIYGHGYYDGNDIPLKNEALFINPDIIGGGIKIKLLTYLNNGIPFISTPFGFEGYSKTLIDNEYCYVLPPEKWSEIIINIFLKYSRG